MKKVLVVLVALVCMFAAPAAQAQHRGRTIRGYNRGYDRGYRSGYGSFGSPALQAAANNGALVDSFFQMGEQYWHRNMRGFGRAGRGYQDYGYQQQYYDQDYYDQGYYGYGRHHNRGILANVLSAGLGFALGRVTAPRNRNPQPEVTPDAPQQREEAPAPIVQYHYRNATGYPINFTSELHGSGTFGNKCTFSTTNEDHPGFTATKPCQMKSDQQSQNGNNVYIDLACKEGGK